MKGINIKKTPGAEARTNKTSTKGKSWQGYQEKTALQQEILVKLAQGSN